MKIKNLNMRMNKNARNNIKNNEKAITLIALVITIIVLIILAGVSISLVLGNDGIISKAREARDNFQRAAEEEQDSLDALLAELNEKIGTQGSSSENGGQGGGEETPKGPNGKPLVNQETISELTTEKVTGEDKLGNQIVIPEGFKLAQGTNGSGDTVKDGIVIEDSVGNQYVWIPVSNINHDGTGKIKVNSADEEGVEITLGRYTFDTTTGEQSTTEGTYQYASSYATPVALASAPTGTSKYYQELTTHRESNYSSGTDGTNSTAKNLQGFVESVRDNKGYYIARYEASYRTNGKAGSIQSTSSNATLALTSAPATRTAGDLWNFIKQGEAAAACQDLYKISETKTTVNSDLMNSYAWDTAIVYIQAMGNTNYANANRGSNTSLKNTGTTGDEKCKIFDMAGNEYEWTTEYSSHTNSSGAGPCVGRGGHYYYSGFCTRSRGYNYASFSDRDYSFRSALWL